MARPAALAVLCCLALASLVAADSSSNGPRCGNGVSGSTHFSFNASRLIAVGFTLGARTFSAPNAATALTVAACRASCASAADFLVLAPGASPITCADACSGCKPVRVVASAAVSVLSGKCSCVAPAIAEYLPVTWVCGPACAANATSTSGASNVIGSIPAVIGGSPISVTTGLPSVTGSVPIPAPAPAGGSGSVPVPTPSPAPWTPNCTVSVAATLLRKSIVAVCSLPNNLGNLQMVCRDCQPADAALKPTDVSCSLDTATFNAKCCMVASPSTCRSLTRCRTGETGCVAATTATVADADDTGSLVLPVPAPAVQPTCTHQVDSDGSARATCCSGSNCTTFSCPKSSKPAELDTAVAAAASSFVQCNAVVGTTASPANSIQCCVRRSLVDRNPAVCKNFTAKPAQSSSQPAVQQWTCTVVGQREVQCCRSTATNTSTTEPTFEELPPVPEARSADAADAASPVAAAAVAAASTRAATIAGIKIALSAAGAKGLIEKTASKWANVSDSGCTRLSCVRCSYNATAASGLTVGAACSVSTRGNDLQATCVSNSAVCVFSRCPVTDAVDRSPKAPECSYSSDSTATCCVNNASSVGLSSLACRTHKFVPCAVQNATKRTAECLPVTPPVNDCRVRRDRCSNATGVLDCPVECCRKYPNADTECATARCVADATADSKGMVTCCATMADGSPQCKQVPSLQFAEAHVRDFVSNYSDSCSRDATSRKITCPKKQCVSLPLGGANVTDELCVTRTCEATTNGYRCCRKSAASAADSVENVTAVTGEVVDCVNYNRPANACRTLLDGVCVNATREACDLNVTVDTKTKAVKVTIENVLNQVLNITEETQHVVSRGGKVNCTHAVSNVTNAIAQEVANATRLQCSYVPHSIAEVFDANDDNRTDASEIIKEYYFNETQFGNVERTVENRTGVSVQKFSCTHLNDTANPLARFEHMVADREWDARESADRLTRFVASGAVELTADISTQWMDKDTTKLRVCFRAVCDHPATAEQGVTDPSTVATPGAEDATDDDSQGLTVTSSLDASTKLQIKLARDSCGVTGFTGRALLDVGSDGITDLSSNPKYTPAGGSAFRHCMLVKVAGVRKVATRVRIDPTIDVTSAASTTSDAPAPSPSPDTPSTPAPAPAPVDVPAPTPSTPTPSTPAPVTTSSAASVVASIVLLGCSLFASLL